MEKISVRKIEEMKTTTVWDWIYLLYNPVGMAAIMTGLFGLLGAIIGLVPTFAVLLINILLLRPRIRE